MVRVAGSLEGIACLFVSLFKVSWASWPRGQFAKPWGKDEFGEREKKGPVPALRPVLLRCRLLDTRLKGRTQHGFYEVLNVDLCVLLRLA